MDYEFTAKLEDRLDAIAEGKEKREPLLKILEALSSAGRSC